MSTKSRVAYSVVSWLLIQIATLLLIAGFPVAVGLFVGVRADGGGKSTASMSARRPPAETIARLKDILAKCELALGYLNDGLLFG
jgi:hypothetical protein